MRRFFRKRAQREPTGAPDARLGALGDAFAWAGLTILDVGARGGALPWMRRLAPYARYIACEPGESETPRDSIWREHVIVREALASTPGMITLHVTANGGFTSMLAPDQEMARDFCLAAEMAEIGQTQVPATTLAEAAERYNFQDLGLIKLDTQGSELDILRSGEALIADAVQAVFIECEFRRFYLSQPLFSDIDPWLRERGFDLIALEPTSRRRKTTVSPSYSKPEIAWAHALYVKDVPDIAALGAEEALRRVLRQVAVAVAYEYFDLAAQRLAKVQGLMQEAGLRAGPADLDAYVRAAAGSGVSRGLSEGAPDVVRHRIPLYVSEPD